MRPEQERVRNLLIDTVTLLCKNSVQFKDELHVEGLLGVSVDKKDVFFVHISKEFTNSPSDGAAVTQDSTDSQNEESLRTDEPRETHERLPDTDNYEAVKIKSEKVEQTDLEDECLIVEDPNVKLEGIVSPAQMVAGQRRATKRTSHNSQHYADSSDYSSAGYAMDSNTGYGPSGEPLSKRRADNQADDSYTQDNGDSGGTGWPTIAAMSSFDLSQQHSFQQDSDNSQMSMPDGSQPGCSSWSAGPSESTSGRRRAAGGQRRRPGGGQGEGPELAPMSYTCCFCSRRFPHKGNYLAHLRSHSGERLFQCPTCQMSFPSKRNMLHHARCHPAAASAKT